MKKIIFLTISVATLIGITPFAADKIVSKHVATKIADMSADISKQDPTADVVYNDISYDIFQDLITIKGLSYHSIEQGLEVSMSTLVFTPVSYDPSEYNGTISDLPEHNIVQVTGGWLEIRDSKLNDSNRKYYNFFAGADNKIDFSTNFKGEYEKASGIYKHNSNIFVENAGTIGLILDLEEFISSSQKQTKSYKDIRVNNLRLSFSTDNTKSILNKLFDVTKYTSNEEGFGVELEKLANKLESEDNLEGFAKPIRDLSKSYYSGRKITVTLSASKPLDSQALIAAIIMAQSSKKPAQVANTLGLKLTSSLR